MAVIDGGEFRVKVGGKVVAFATSSTINLSTEYAEIAPVATANAEWKSIVPIRKKASIDTNALMGTSDNYDFGDLWDAWTNGTLISIEFSSEKALHWSITANAYIASLSATGAVSQDSTIRAKFEIDGLATLKQNSAEKDNLITDDTGTIITDDEGAAIF